MLRLLLVLSSNEVRHTTGSEFTFDHVTLAAAFTFDHVTLAMASPGFRQGRAVSSVSCDRMS